jgi:hypothetical protein
MVIINDNNSNNKYNNSNNSIVSMDVAKNTDNDALDVTINLFNNQSPDREKMFLTDINSIDSDIDLILEEELRIVFVNKTLKSKKKSVTKIIKEKVMHRINDMLIEKDRLINEKELLIQTLMEKINLIK